MANELVVDILIVEDEFGVLQGMKNAIERSGLPFGRIYAVGSAEDAESIMRAKLPQIIVTDIVLPRRSGLDLLEAVKGTSKYDPKVIVVSSYNEFEYARRSLLLGAIDYMLKPFEMNDLVAKLATVAQHLTEEHNLRHRHRINEERARVGHKVMRNEHLLGYCTEKTMLQEHIYHFLQLWDLEWLTTSKYRVIAFDTDSELPEHDKEAQLRLFSIGNISEETVERRPFSCLFSNWQHRWVVLTALRDYDDLVRELRENVQSYHRLGLRFGISAAVFSFQSLSDAYHQALAALHRATLEDEPEQHYEDLEQEETASEDIDEQCAAAVLDADPKRLAACVHDKVEQLIREQGAASRRPLGQACLDWLVQLQTSIQERTGLMFNHIPLSLWERLDRFESVSSLKSDIVDYLLPFSEELARRLSPPESERAGNAWIEQAKRAIDEMDAADISLHAVAERLLLHPVWLSQLFKKETGRTFSEYLIDWRLNKAKLLLKESPLKIYEIAEKVGYQDLQHFGKLFKKRVGVSPKEYRFGR
ncbi:response regulator [Cohnella fermenti]|uniref:Response regulator n=1 Tax=Cohnella fermenti TaxID=2565925 RepID=A0A4S4BI15_9BACL|nr:helix-turn-helix domain-containing protein [Cohnella fermenti]THF73603.1 response regulator [Cohnella fermenti]